MIFDNDKINIMNTITISKKLLKSGDVIIIPRREYEALLELKRIREFKPTNVQKKALLKAQDNFKKGKTLSYNEFVRKSGFTN